MHKCEDEDQKVVNDKEYLDSLLKEFAFSNGKK